MSDSIMTKDAVSPNLDSLVRQVLTSRVYEVSKETPLDPANKLSRRLRNNIKLKREDLQPIFSFKIRVRFRIRGLSFKNSNPRL